MKILRFYKPKNSAFIVILIKFLFIYLAFSIIPVALIAQDNQDFDSQFLDERFFNTIETEDLEANSQDKELSNDIPEDIPEIIPNDDLKNHLEDEGIAPQKKFYFNFDNHWFYQVVNIDNPYNPQKINYDIQFRDLIHANFLFKHNFLNQKVLFSFDSSLYLHIIRYESDNQRLEVNRNVYLNELSFLINLNRYVALSIGKIRNHAGTGFIISPTDFFSDYPYFEEYDNTPITRRMGSYQLRLDLFFNAIDFSIAYLPLIKTIYNEFTREYTDKNPYIGELWSKLSFRAGDINTSFILFWNGYLQGGINLNWSIGDEIILHFDGGGALTSLPNIVENGEYQLPIGNRGSLVSVKRYRVDVEYLYQGQGVLGISYTPASVLTLLAEVYLNIDKDNNSWNNHASTLNDINNIVETLNSTPFNAVSEEYTGVLGNSLTLHDPLKMQPIFLSVRIFRDNALSHYTTYIINLSTQLVYSPVDTTFTWSSSLTWQTPVVLDVGLKTSLYFGKARGVFTSLPENFRIHFFTLVRF